jgi:hypothetical protein
MTGIRKGIPGEYITARARYYAGKEGMAQEIAQWILLVGRPSIPKPDV